VSWDNWREGGFDDINDAVDVTVGGLKYDQNIDRVVLNKGNEQRNPSCVAKLTSTPLGLPVVPLE
jgi:hypothetical protein